MMTIELPFCGQNIIGSKLSAEGHAFLEAFDPVASKTLPGKFMVATENEVNRALEVAKHAFEAYRHLDHLTRAEFLETIAEEIFNLGDVLIERASKETGLPKARISGERQRTIGQLQLFANLLREGSWVEATIDLGDASRVPQPKPDIRKLQIPIGPVVVFGASNFPLAFSTAGGDTASALAAGNPVIVKAHEAHPGTNELVARAITIAAEKSGVPVGVFSMLHGSGETIGKMLVQNQDTRAIAFTGSTKVGRHLMKLATEREDPIPVYAEMGSTNPIILLPQGVATQGKLLAKTIGDSLTLGVGQFCTNPGLLIALESPELREFIQHLQTFIHESLPQTMLSKRTWQNYNDNKKTLLSCTDVKLEASAKNRHELIQFDGVACLASVSAGSFMANPHLKEEVFGPFTLMVICQSREEMEAVAGTLPGQLTVSLMGEDLEIDDYEDLINLLAEKTGRILFNNVPTGVEVCAAMHHGGPFPATSNASFTAVGTGAIKRFVRPICYQNFPENLLPEALKNANNLDIWRMVNNEWTKDDIITTKVSNA